MEDGQRMEVTFGSSRLGLTHVVIMRSTRRPPSSWESDDDLPQLNGEIAGTSLSLEEFWIGAFDLDQCT